MKKTIHPVRLAGAFALCMGAAAAGGCKPQITNAVSNPGPIIISPDGGTDISTPVDSSLLGTWKHEFSVTESYTVYESDQLRGADKMEIQKTDTYNFALLMKIKEPNLFEIRQGEKDDTFNDSFLLATGIIYNEDGVFNVEVKKTVWAEGTPSFVGGIKGQISIVPSEGKVTVTVGKQFAQLNMPALWRLQPNSQEKEDKDLNFSPYEYHFNITMRACLGGDWIKQ